MHRIFPPPPNAGSRARPDCISPPTPSRRWAIIASAISSRTPRSANADGTLGADRAGPRLSTADASRSRIISFDHPDMGVAPPMRVAREQSPPPRRRLVQQLRDQGGERNGMFSAVLHYPARDRDPQALPIDPIPAHGGQLAPPEARCEAHLHQAAKRAADASTPPATQRCDLCPLSAPYHAPRPQACLPWWRPACGDPASGSMAIRPCESWRLRNVRRCFRNSRAAPGLPLRSIRSIASIRATRSSCARSRSER